MPSDSVKIDLSYKKFSKKEYTSTDKKWHEEFPGQAINIKFSEIWTEEIPSTPPSISNSIIEVVNELILTKDVTVDNSLSWYACSITEDLNTRIGNFIQPDQLIPQSYYVRIYDDTGQQIFVGNSVNWEFDYPNGVLTFENQPTNFVSPFKISCYRYIGKTGDKDSFVTTLDEAYDGVNGNGEGKIIHADFGPVQISASNGSAALQLDPIEYTPTTGLADGQIINREGILYLYDSSRGKWLSMIRQPVTFGIKRADGCYLNVSDFSSSMSGWPALRDGVITGMTVQASHGYSSKIFTLSKNNDPTSLLTFQLTGHYYSNGNLNINFDANDLIKILASSQYSITHNVVLNLEIAWKI